MDVLMDGVILRLSRTEDYFRYRAYQLYKNTLA